jgi:4-hydroxybenzoate polyprenyltransferase
VFLAAACFLVLQLAYTFALKRLVILDVMAIAGGFVLRVVAGAVAIGVVASPWIILCTALLSMFLALIKRRCELTGDDDLTTHRPALAHYTEPFLDSMIATITAATIVAYSLYTFLSHERHEPSWMMVTIPFVVYGLFRYLYLVHLKGLGGNPEEILVGDVPLIVDIVLFVAVSILVLRLA